MLFPASYSKLSTYEKCPQQAKFRYVDMLNPPKTQQMARGTSLHSSAEGYLLRQKTTIAAPLVSLLPVLKVVRDSKPHIELKIAFNHDFEKVVDWKDKKAWFRMVLDSAYVEPTEAHVQEWKSGKEYDDHEDQRNLYAVGALGMWPVKYANVTTYYMDLRKKKTLRLDRPQAKLAGWRFAERVEAMGRDKHLTPRPGYYCRWCPFSRFVGGPCKVG
jgi:CRISPR/Cas system-associated exonuclease Cas4 (RecB family)